MKPASEQADYLYKLYDYFNGELFGGALPQPYMNQISKKNCLGHFAPNKWEKGKGPNANSIHELSISPSDVKHEDLRELCQTLVHEQCHVWQFVFGEKYNKNGYHNKEWGSKMKEVGLHPSHDGTEGGKETGYNMMDYVIPGGAFQRAYHEMDKTLFLPWHHRIRDGIPKEPGEEDEEAKVKEKKKKVAYICTGCDTKVWGKPGLAGKLGCGPCKLSFVQVENED